MPTKYNALKRQVLEILKDFPGLTSRDLRLEIGITRTNICDCLLRLHQQRLVDREVAAVGRPGRPQFAYEINQRGRDKLEHWSAEARLIR